MTTDDRTDVPNKVSFKETMNTLNGVAALRELPVSVVREQKLKLMP